jgi:hypothetical protein
MQISVTVETRKLEDALHNLAREARVAPGVVMKQEAKTIVEKVMDMTFPATLAIGRRAVNRDVGKVFASLPGIKKRIKKMEFPNKKGYMAAINRAARSNNEGELRALLTQTVTQSGQTRVRAHTRNGVAVSEYMQQRNLDIPMVPGMDGSTIIGGNLNPNLHTVRRNAQGRVQRDYLSQVVMTSAPLNEYRKQVLSRVGWHKAGWVALAEAVGAKIRPWVKNTRLATTSGIASVNFVGPNPKISATNYDTKIPNYQGLVNFVVNTRIKATVIKIERLIAGKAVNLGFTRVAAR